MIFLSDIGSFNVDCGQNAPWFSNKLIQKKKPVVIIHRPLLTQHKRLMVQYMKLPEAVLGDRYTHALISSESQGANRCLFEALM